MDANHINSIIKGTNETLSKILNKELSTDSPYTKNKLDAKNAILGSVGFNGDIEGQVIYSFDNSYAKKVLSAMCGMDITEFDKMALSALSELCNMISGCSATYFTELARQEIKITPPAVFSGDNMQVSTKSPILCIPFLENNNTVLEINYTLV